MYQASDPKLLQWLADEDRVLLTHDKSTIPNYVYERIKKGKCVVGVIIVIKSTPIKIAIDELEVLLGAGEREDFQNLVLYVKSH
jgi:hypothetical protein